jgi:hypothetical protein
MSNIPEGRRRLRELASRVLANDIAQVDAYAEIIDVIDQCLVREQPVRRAPARPRRITDEVKKRIKVFAAANPKAHQTDIGHVFGVNPGRVSEILTGKR